MDNNIIAFDDVSSKVQEFKIFLEMNTGSDGLDVLSNRKLYLSLINTINLINAYKKNYIDIIYGTPAVLPGQHSVFERRLIRTEGPGTPSKIWGPRYDSDSDSDSD